MPRTRLRPLGYCNMHYSRWKRHGDPLLVVHHRFRSQWYRDNPEAARVRHLEIVNASAKRRWQRLDKEYTRANRAQRRINFNKRMSESMPNPRREPWTPAEDYIAIRNDITIKEICFMLNRTPNQVLWRRAKHRRENIVAAEPAGRLGAPWSHAEDAIVTQADITPKEIAALIQRPARTVRQRRYTLRQRSLRA